MAINQNNATPAATPEGTQPEWQGYTLEQLRFQRALALIKLENEKAVLAQKANQKIEQFKSNTSAKGVTGNIFKMISGRLKWVDYALIGFNIAKLVTRLRRR